MMMIMTLGNNNMNKQKKTNRVCEILLEINNNTKMRMENKLSIKMIINIINQRLIECFLNDSSLFIYSIVSFFTKQNIFLLKNICDTLKINEYYHHLMNDQNQVQGISKNKFNLLSHVTLTFLIIYFNSCLFLLLLF